MWIVLALIVGILIGLASAYIIFCRLNDGYLYLSKADPDFMTAGFSFSKGAAEVANKKRLVIRIVSQK